MAGQYRTGRLPERTLASSAYELFALFLARDKAALLKVER
jgi:hypothetical protein